MGLKDSVESKETDKNADQSTGDKQKITSKPNLLLGKSKETSQNATSAFDNNNSSGAAAVKKPLSTKPMMGGKKPEKVPYRLPGQEAPPGQNDNIFGTQNTNL